MPRKKKTDVVTEESVVTPVEKETEEKTYTQYNYGIYRQNNYRRCITIAGRNITKDSN